jgi:hypothetical protein
MIFLLDVLNRKILFNNPIQDSYLENVSIINSYTETEKFV